LKLKYDALLSSFAFKFNLRRCIKVTVASLYRDDVEVTKAGASQFSGVPQMAVNASRI
jgi:hypothetical protein